jgi:hypothetical protein
VRGWAAGLVILMVLAAAGAWWLWPHTEGRVDTTGCIARTPGIAEASADYNVYLREHCGTEGSGEGGEAPAR